TRCPKDCKSLLSTQLRTCKAECPKHRAGNGCRAVCRTAHASEMTTCKVAALPSPPFCGATTSTSTSTSTSTTTTDAPFTLVGCEAEPFDCHHVCPTGQVCSYSLDLTSCICIAGSSPCSRDNVDGACPVGQACFTFGGGATFCTAYGNPCLSSPMEC